jgi:hypothetical protein
LKTVLSVWRKKQTVSKSEHAQAKEIAHGLQHHNCASCGIKMLDGGVGIAFEDSNPNNLEQENVRAVCKLCEALFKGGRLNKASDSGYLVYLPDISQLDLICFLAAYFSLKVDDPNKASILQSVQYDELKALRKTAAKYIGFSEISSMQELLSNMTNDTYENRKVALGPIRWWPDIEDETIRDALRKYKNSGFLKLEDIEELSKSL